MSYQATKSYVRLDFTLLAKQVREKSPSFPVNRPSVFSCINPKLTVPLTLGICYYVYPLYQQPAATTAFTAESKQVKLFSHW